MIQYSINNKKVIFFFLLILLIGGITAFGNLAKKEDAPFVIKQAVVFVNYPGASPQEMEERVTSVIERKLQTMPNIYKISSDSYLGFAKIDVELQPYTPASETEQMWDILRRKMIDIEPQLPAEAIVTVNDDFGDVFGIYYGLVASEGFNYNELRWWARNIEKELSTVDGVEEVALYGIQNEIVKLEISLPELSKLNITPNEIATIIAAQNKIIDPGERSSGDGVTIKFFADGIYSSLDDIRNQVIISNNMGQLKIGDIATVTIEYATPAKNLMYINGKKSIGIAISSPSNKDVVKSGENVKAKLREIERGLPIGIDIVSLYAEDEIAEQANIGFIMNLLESIAIVIIVLMIVMGFKSSLLIGSSLLFSISGTLLIMQFIETGLNRTSLAGFIIAMGMLVDNAIVVVDNTQTNLKRGMPLRQAVVSGATTPMWGLLGATLIAIFSFLPLYLAKAAVAEIVQPLFVVIGVSLLLSWLLALSQTTSFAMFMLKEPKQNRKEGELYSGKLYKAFEKLLKLLIKHRYLTITSMVALLIFSLYIMGVMPQNFFPNLDKNYFRAEIFMPNGYSIDKTRERALEIDQWLHNDSLVENVSITVGSSPPRYYLASAAFGPMPSFASFLVELTTKDSTVNLENRFNRYLRNNYPDLVVKSSLFKVSPVPEATIEIGFVGENIDTLVMLTNQVKEIMRECDKVDQVRDSWGNKIDYLIPEYSVEKGGRLGISRQMMAQSYSIINSGLPVGRYGEDDSYIPIMLKSEETNFNLNDVANIPIIAGGGRSVPLSAVTDTIRLTENYNAIRRFNHSRVMYAQCEPKRGANSVEGFNYIYDRAQNEIALPDGYTLRIKGERESQVDSNKALAENLPFTLILIFITLLLLFRDFKRPAVILSMIPLIFIGVVFGLVIMGKMFDFFSILGLLGLIGMNIKNAIVLIEQIDIETKEGLDPYRAIIAAAKSRLVPVTMAAGTTILGMIPLLSDAMFAGMAATIMGGLFVATLLTMLILPVAYATIFKIKQI